MTTLVEIVGRYMRQTPSGQLYLEEKDVPAILKASQSLGNGEELYNACTELIAFVGFLNRHNGAPAAHVLVTRTFGEFAKRLATGHGGEHFRDKARQLAELSAEQSNTGAAMQPPKRVGAGIRRQR